jgi:O-antigen/teichoic acid export membrane protein
MLMASVAGGVFMWLVHPLLVKRVDQVPLGPITEFLKRIIQNPISESDYGLFNTLLSILVIMSIPGAGLQIIFAQQTAAAVDESHERQLRGTVRTILAATALIWIVAVVIIVSFRQRIIGNLSIPNPSALWITLVAGLPLVWSPILGGLLQGRQNFLWLGWSSIMAGFGRCLAVVVIVRILGGGIPGAMLSALLGALAALSVAFWQTYRDWHGPREPVRWAAWSRRVIPLTLGLGASTFMMSADMIVVRSLFPEQQTGFYSAAGIIGRALVLFTAPLAAVMFPKIVHSAVRSERTDVMAQALGATALLGAGAALFCTLFPALPLQIVYDKSYLVIKPLVPWFVWCMLPLTLSNVLINNLLAREKFAVVGWLVIVVLGYVATLLLVANHLVHREQLAAFKAIVQILGTFSLILLAVSIYFTWRKK